MPRAGLSAEAVTDLAIALVDEAGLDSLSLAAIASRASVATPSLYKHVASLADVRVRVATAAARELARRSVEATVGVSGPDALRALGRAIRVFARERPGLYAATQVALPESGSSELESAQAEAVAIVVAVLRGFGLPSSRAVDAVRVARASIHGFVQLEANGGFGMPDDVDQSFETLLDVLVDGIAALAR